MGVLGGGGGASEVVLLQKGVGRADFDFSLAMLKEMGGGIYYKVFR